MNPRTKTARSSTPFLMAANEGKTPNAGVPVEFQHLCNFGMEGAIEIEKASLATVVCLNSCVLDLYKNAFWFAPEVGNLFDTAAESFAFCMELHRNWLDQLASLALSGESAVASSSGRQAKPKADALAHSMDIAIGERFTASRATLYRVRPTARAA
jgi:hypothetical protein